jgi:hypothetical protein
VSAFGSLAKQPVFSSNDEGFDAALCTVVIDIQMSILCVGDEFILLIECVEDSLT